MSDKHKKPFRHEIPVEICLICTIYSRKNPTVFFHLTGNEEKAIIML